MARSLRVIPIVAQGKTARPAGGALEFRNPPPLALYMHVPWCVRKCPYCDFNSHEVQGHSSHQVRGYDSHEVRGEGTHALRDDIPEKEYVAALLADLESALPLVWGRRVNSVFFGGGTPSLLSGSAVDTLLTAIRTLLPLAPDAEITLEANPGTVEADKFAAFRDAGVNRLSLGVQSFDATKLRALGRVHDDRQARRAIEIAATYFDNFNIDLMYGLPGQSVAEALGDVETALAFTPPHLSCYQLTLEPNTAFAAAPPFLPEHDACADMQDAIETRLAGAGYTHYETSAFAQPGRHCRHNVNYWSFGDYLGIGAGAHGKLTLHDRVLRQMRWKQPRQYMEKVAQASPIQDEFAVAVADLPFEFMMNALRLNQGFDAALFEARTTLPLFSIENELREAEADGLLVRRPGHIAPSEHGRRFLNQLLERFIHE